MRDSSPVDARTSVASPRLAAAPSLADLLGPVRVDLDRLNRELPQDLFPGNADLSPLLEHVGRYRGKQLRPALVYLAASATGGVREVHHTIAKVVELIHVATLVHDDILDGAELRRRLPTIHALHGNEIAVLLGDSIYAKAFALAVQLEDQTCSRMLSEVTRTICNGEITQILHRFDFAWTEARYFEVIRDKTASLYAAACRLGAHYAGGSRAECEAFDTFGTELGIAFQIVDDCLDLDGEERVVGKSLGTDLEKGKLTLPLLWIVKHSPGGADRLRRLVADESPARHLQRLRAEFPLQDAVAYALRAAQARIVKARAALDRIPATPARAALDGVADYVLAREL